MFCNKCGCTLPEESVFCPKCGAKIPQINEVDEVKETSEQIETKQEQTIQEDTDNKDSKDKETSLLKSFLPQLEQMESAKDIYAFLEDKEISDDLKKKLNEEKEIERMYGNKKESSLSKIKKYIGDPTETSADEQSTCKRCGMYIGKGREYCSACENAIKNASSEKTPVSEDNKIIIENKPQEQIMQRLKPYRKTTNCTCMECGYSGQMGVVGYKMGIFRRLLIPLAIAIVGWFFIAAFGHLDLFTFRSMWAPLVFAIGTIGSNYTKKVLYCPNCARQIYTR